MQILVQPTETKLDHFYWSMRTTQSCILESNSNITCTATCELHKNMQNDHHTYKMHSDPFELNNVIDDQD